MLQFASENQKQLSSGFHSPAKHLQNPLEETSHIGSHIKSCFAMCKTTIFHGGISSLLTLQLPEIL
jgi:hypothetical protein